VIPSGLASLVAQIRELMLKPVSYPQLTGSIPVVAEKVVDC
jgi:hypothetical protein